MKPELRIHRSGPGVSVQDLGRQGFLSQGLSRGGAADPVGLAEGAALLAQSANLAAIEIAGAAIDVEVTAPTWVAFTGAPMSARRGDGKLVWNACHLIHPADRLRIGSLQAGNYAYLHVAGGIDTPVRVGGRGAHLAADLGAPIAAGDALPIGPGPTANRQAQRLPDASRFNGGEVRMLRGPHTGLFPESVLHRFLDTPFIRTAWGNRQGVKLGFEGDGFRPAQGLHLVSEFIVPGDIQITGDGTPYVLGSECQTIGGYPRIGTVLPQDLPRIVQATPGSELHFRMVTVEEAMSDHRSPESIAQELSGLVQPLVRDPNMIPDLLSYQLISGVVAGDDPYEEETLE